MRIPPCAIALVMVFAQVIGSKHQLIDDRKPISDTESEGRLKQKVYRKIIGIDSLSELRRLANAVRQGKIQERIDGPFPCDYPRSFRSPQRPVSAHRLMPGDVDVVAAMGDSLTAGMGATATSPFASLIENRGFSWCIGGIGEWRDFLTLPNILKEFNPNLVGFSTGDGTSVDAAAGFNVGEPGALSHQMLYQAKVLVERIRRDRRVNFQLDWKLISLMIGNNDICSEMCYLNNPASVVDSHYWGVRAALDYLRDNLPRTFVNVIPISKVPNLTDIEFPKSCYLTHTVFCSCVFGPRFEANREYYIDIGHRLQKATIDAVEDGDYGWKYESFAAVVQPYLFNDLYTFYPNSLNNFSTPKSIFTVTAPDCFHYNQLGYAIAANALWNNMLQPVGAKDDCEPVKLMEEFFCPTKSLPYFYTNRNSGGVKLFGFKKLWNALYKSSLR